MAKAGDSLLLRAEAKSGGIVDLIDGAEMEKFALAVKGTGISPSI